ncbi:MAG TPA: nodulation protein NfeD [Burkholderiales bacterium]|nr:nodulation protein NfeD [Burkholderiales bacterium]
MGMPSYNDRRSMPAQVRSRWFYVLLVLAFILHALAALAQDAEQGATDIAPVVTLTIKGPIGVGAGMQVEQAVGLARERNASLLLITLDTPGGLVSTTREIIQSILGSSVPVAVYVAPSGARAASAGTYIVYAAHIAAMAPGTSIGAATPVAMQGPIGGPQPEEKPATRDKDGKDGKPAAPDTAMERKALNDAIAFLRSLAQMRGRNIEWADEAVRDAATLTGKEAASMNVVDLLADNQQALLEALHGRSVQTSAGKMEIVTRDAPLVAAEPSLRIRVLAAVADPNVAFILLLIGIYGLIFEFWNPGTGVTGVIGAVCLLLALTALTMLPVHYGGLALLLLGLALMTAEAFSPGVGVMGIGGLIAFVVGSIFLFDPSDSDFDFGVALPLILGAAAASAGLFIFVLGAALRARRGPVATGAEQMIGARGVVREWQAQEGVVQVCGESWRARSDQTLAPGVAVEVTARDGLVVEVRPLNNDSDFRGRAPLPDRP